MKLHGLNGLPDRVVDLIQSQVSVEFATVSAAGLPIDTPAYCMPDQNLASIDVATGLSYPAKAERARRQPRVGLLFEGNSDEPVVSIAGMAAVRDADIQRNVMRYLAETCAYGANQGVGWDLARKATWYWARIFIHITPKLIFWWDNASALGTAPHRWEAPSDRQFPLSDPAPLSAVSVAPKWDERVWQEVAELLVHEGVKGHLTLCDIDGFPLPMGANSIELTDDGFTLEVPPFDRWVDGPATLSFYGRSIFAGTASRNRSMVRLRVERLLPALPFMGNPAELFSPTPPTRAALMNRLEQELARRGQSAAPDIPDDEPEPTVGAMRRKAKLSAARAP